MFITKEELQTAIYEYQLADITGMDVDDIAVWHRRIGSVELPEREIRYPGHLLGRG